MLSSEVQCYMRTCSALHTAQCGACLAHNHVLSRVDSTPAPCAAAVAACCRSSGRPSCLPWPPRNLLASCSTWSWTSPRRSCKLHTTSSCAHGVHPNPTPMRPLRTVPCVQSGRAWGCCCWWLYISSCPTLLAAGRIVCLHVGVPGRDTSMRVDCIHPRCSCLAAAFAGDAFAFMSYL